jgi:tetratricopeptide (TPR) repeat protein
VRTLGNVCLVVCLLGGTDAFAQFMAGNPTHTEFRGRLTEGGVSSYEGLVVEVTNLRDRSIRDHVDVLADGSFGFRALSEGDYQVRVTTLYDDEVTSTLTSIAPGSPSLEIRLPQSRLSKPPAGSISLHQLNHPPSRQVQKLLESGERLLHDQHYDDAAARLREATADAPDCLQAHADLGLALSRMGQWDGAAQEYRAAVSLDPRNSMLHSNLGAALTVLQHFDEAEVEIVTALRLDPRNPRAHFVMAGVLLHKHAPLTEAMPHLLAAQDEVPSARTSIQRICAKNRIAGCP